MAKPQAISMVYATVSEASFVSLTFLSLPFVFLFFQDFNQFNGKAAIFGAEFAGYINKNLSGFLGSEGKKACVIK